MLFKNCPVGCDSKLSQSEIPLPEGPLLRCSECGQLLSQCPEEVFKKSMKRFEDSDNIDKTPRVHLKRLKRIQRNCIILFCKRTKLPDTSPDNPQKGVVPLDTTPFFLMVGDEGFEPSTSAV